MYYFNIISVFGRWPQCHITFVSWLVGHMRANARTHKHKHTHTIFMSHLTRIQYSSISLEIQLYLVMANIFYWMIFILCIAFFPGNCLVFVQFAFVSILSILLDGTLNLNVSIHLLINQLKHKRTKIFKHKCVIRLVLGIVFFFFFCISTFQLNTLVHCIFVWLKDQSCIPIRMKRIVFSCCALFFSSLLQYVRCSFGHFSLQLLQFQFEFI